MNKERYLHFIASFLIVLVLSIPFYTTSVYATITQVSVKGNDGIEGFAKPDDSLNFVVDASINGGKVTSDQVVLGAGIKFQKCSPSINNGSECTLKFSDNSTGPFEGKSLAFTIKLFKPDNTLDDAKTGSVTIDNKPPQVHLSSQSRFSSQQSAVIDYDATDFACDDPSCNDKCVGIKSIDFYTQDGAFKHTVNPETNDCNVQSSINIDPKIFNDGRNSVFAKATDKFSHVSPETSVTFTVDNSGPVIIPESFQILRQGASIDAFPSSGINVDVIVNISGNDLDFNSVKADLSALHPSQQLKNAKAICAPVADSLSTCRWSAELNPGAAGLKNIVINASDTSGNHESAAISKLMSLDDKGPVVKSLSTSSAKSTGEALAKPSGNTITAVFDEATGLTPDQVFLHADNSKIAATGCGKNSTWVCTWDNVNFGSSSSRISIESDTTDILGNAVAERSQVDLTIDDKPPVLRSMNISPVGGIVQAFPGFLKIGDKIAVLANVTEDNDVSAVADFSKFISGASNVAGSCEKIQADENTCTWLTDTINLQASDAITFKFSDNAGNQLVVTKSLRTFGLENATVPDFWSSTVACSPAAIDRQLGPLINQRVFCQVALKPKSTTKPVSTVFISPAACSGDTSIVQSVETLNTEVGSTSPLIKLTLKKDEFRINNANLSCSLSIFSKVGSSTTITRNPEIENAAINIQFFNLPLGEFGDEVSKKIKDAKDDAKGIYELIGTLNKLVFYAKKICQIINVVFNVLGLLMVVYMAFAKSSSLCPSTGILVTFGVCSAMNQVKGTMCGAHAAASGTAENLKGYADKFCSFVNCQQALLWGPGLQNWINNLPFPVTPGRYLGPETKVEGQGFDQKVVPVSDGKSATTFDALRDKTYGLRPISEYMNPRSNLLVAALFVCLPGIIYGLDKYRQIKCLYADCLQNAVGKEGLPITACEDQKAYATCKYITGEIFAVIPWTAVFDHFVGIIKNSLSNPFAVLGIAVAIYCRQPSCKAGQEVPEFGQFYFGCAGIRLLTLIGDTAQNVKNIIDEGFTIRTDYCARLEDNAETPSSPPPAKQVKKD